MHVARMYYAQPLGVSSLRICSVVRLSLPVQTCTCCMCTSVICAVLYQRCFPNIPLTTFSSTKFGMALCTDTCSPSITQRSQRNLGLLCATSKKLSKHNLRAELNVVSIYEENFKLNLDNAKNETMHYFLGPDSQAQLFDTGSFRPRVRHVYSL